jgi:hypothetical protein
MKEYTVRLTPKQLECVIMTIEEGMSCIDNPALARDYRNIIRRLFKAYEQDQTKARSLTVGDESERTLKSQDSRQMEDSLAKGKGK